MSLFNSALFVTVAGR